MVIAKNIKAWNNKFDLDSDLLACRLKVMIGRNGWGFSYLTDRGEILGFVKDELMRKHLPKMFSLIKSESWGIEDDQIPS